MYLTTQPLGAKGRQLRSRAAAAGGKRLHGGCPGRHRNQPGFCPPLPVTALANHLLAVPPPGYPCTLCSPFFPSPPKSTPLNSSPGHGIRQEPFPCPFPLLCRILQSSTRSLRNKHLISSVPCSLILPWLPKNPRMKTPTPWRGRTFACPSRPSLLFVHLRP